MITAERAKQLFTYDPETGALARRPETVRACNRSRAASTIRTLDKDGYIVVKVEGKCYPAHRIIFLMMTGRWPHPTVDHDNRDKADNRWVNLTEATHAENNENRGPVRRFDVPNVYKTANTGRYEARAFVGGRKRRLGTYDTPEEADAAIALARGVAS